MSWSEYFRTYVSICVYAGAAGCILQPTSGSNKRKILDTLEALEALNISLEGVRAQVEEIIGQGQQAPSGHIPFTPRAKKVLELSLREALQLGHNYIGTEHILLGLIREGEGVAAQVLVKLGADLNRVRQQVIQLLSGYQGKEAATSSGPAEGTPSTSLVQVRVMLDQKPPIRVICPGKVYRNEAISSRSYCVFP